MESPAKPVTAQPGRTWDFSVGLSNAEVTGGLTASFNHVGGVSWAGVDPRKNRMRKKSVSRSPFQRVFLSIAGIRGGVKWE